VAGIGRPPIRINTGVIATVFLLLFPTVVAGIRAKPLQILFVEKQLFIALVGLDVIDVQFLVKLAAHGASVLLPPTNAGRCFKPLFAMIPAPVSFRFFTSLVGLSHG
jgi:hypothetical protein